MTPHLKIYLEHHGLTVADIPDIGCEQCGKQAKDIHHIEPKGIGGDPSKDRIDNLMALCRHCHRKEHGLNP